MINEKLEPHSRQRDKETKAKHIAVSRADAVICISENTRHDLIDFLNVPEEKTYVVYLGFSLAATAEAPVKFDSKKPFLLYVGKRSGYKNFDALLSSFASSPTLSAGFSLVAFGGGAFTNEENQRIAALGLAPSQVLQIAGDDEVLRSLYSGACCFVYPSSYEGFGIPPLEAMSYGCPVVCSNTSSLPEVVGDAAMLVEPDNIEQMVDAIEKVVFDKDATLELISRGTKRIAQFSWARCAEQTMKIYQSIL